MHILWSAWESDGSSGIFQMSCFGLTIEIVRKHFWKNRGPAIWRGSYYIDAFLPLYVRRGGIYFSLRKSKSTRLTEVQGKGEKE